MNFEIDFDAFNKEAESIKAELFLEGRFGSVPRPVFATIADMQYETKLASVADKGLLEVAWVIDPDKMFDVYESLGGTYNPVG